MTARSEDPTLEPLEAPEPLRVRVHSVLEELIITGKLEPGQRLVETDLASRLQVSRGPIREALQMLAREGWVELRPRLGAFVSQPSIEELTDYFDVRSLLEVESARLAARAVQAHPERHLDSLRRMDDLVASSRDGLPPKDDRGPEEDSSAREFHDTWSRPFHRVIAETTENVAIVDLLERLARRTRWFFTPAVLERADYAWTEHAQIKEAIARGDEDAAAACMEDHMNTTRESFLRSRSLI